MRTFLEISELSGTKMLWIDFEIRDPGFATVFQAIVSHRGKLPQPKAARLLNLSPSRFSHAFQQTFRCSFRSAQQFVKMHIAAFYLGTSKVRVSMIADYFQYSDLKKFEQAFRKQFGVSPSTYRKQFFQRTCPLMNLSTHFDNWEGIKQQVAV